MVWAVYSQKMWMGSEGHTHTHTQPRHRHLGESGPWHRAGWCGGPSQLSFGEIGEVEISETFWAHAREIYQIKG